MPLPLVFEHAPPGPFGDVTTQLALRHHMVEPDLAEDAQPHSIDIHPDQRGFDFSLGQRRYRYSRLGLERLASAQT